MGDQLNLKGVKLAASASVRLIVAAAGGGYKTNATAVDEALKQQSGRVAVSRDQILSRLDKIADAQMIMNCVTRLPLPAGPLLLAMIGQVDARNTARTLAAFMGMAGNQVAERQILGYMSPEGYGPGQPPAIRREIEDRLDAWLCQADAVICERYPDLR
jgi:hypothetical protein